MINENLLQTDSYDKEKAHFTVTLLMTLFKLKQNSNVDDVYMAFNMDKIEIYVFTFKEDFDCEDFIIHSIADWEMQQLYFPEVYINQSEDGKMNILPRGAMKIC